MIFTVLAVAAAQIPTQTIPSASHDVAREDPAALSVARHLVELMKTEDTLTTMFVQLSPSFANAVIGQLATDPQTKGLIDYLTSAAPENRDRMVAILSQEFLAAVRKEFPALKLKLAQEYAAAFTLAELQQLDVFYSTGVGEKLLRLQPQLQATMSKEGQALGAVAGSQAAQRAFERIENEMLSVKERNS